MYNVRQVYASPKGKTYVYFEEYVECTTCEIYKSIMNSDKNIISCVIHRLPNTDTLFFLMKCSVTYLISSSEETSYVPPGDYDINLLNHDTLSATAQFIDMRNSNAFIPLINRPTRVTPSSATLLDNIYQ